MISDYPKTINKIATDLADMAAEIDTALGVLQASVGDQWTWEETTELVYVPDPAAATDTRVLTVGDVTYWTMRVTIPSGTAPSWFLPVMAPDSYLHATLRAAGSSTIEKPVGVVCAQPGFLTPAGTSPTGPCVLSLRTRNSAAVDGWRLDDSTYLLGDNTRLVI